MPKIDFAQMPDDARLWIFAAERAFTPEERDRVGGEVDAFLDTWAAHGAPLRCAREFRYDRFLLVAVDERAAGVSGCSIDALTHSLRALERVLDMTLIDHGPVVYKVDGEIRRSSRADFAELATTGRVSADTMVFDNTVPSVGDLRAGRWEVRAGDAWHGKAFL